MPIKLLIVDDAPFIREVITTAFSGTEFTVIGEAHDGEAAILRARELRPEVILMDIVMPKKSGIEAAAEIMRERPLTKIIACSTIEQDSMVLRALDAGCCGYVTKPFKSEDLLKAVRSAAATIQREKSL